MVMIMQIIVLWVVTPGSLV